MVMMLVVLSFGVIDVGDGVGMFRRRVCIADGGCDLADVDTSAGVGGAADGYDGVVVGRGCLCC